MQRPLNHEAAALFSSSIESFKAKVAKEIDINKALDLSNSGSFAIKSVS
jgi:hypothetical protein